MRDINFSNIPLFAKLSEASGLGGAPAVVTRTPARRQREIDAAAARLEAAGI